MNESATIHFQYVFYIPIKSQDLDLNGVKKTKYVVQHNSSVKFMDYPDNWEWKNN